ncbi:MAG: bifunctional DNA primase/polymerase [Methanomicrobiales archaeon]|nr:bifunctional DNA primase/polymerase [Methanomicrobiales archaeon]
MTETAGGGDPPPRDTTMIVAALETANRGWPVFPIHTPGPGGLCTCGAVPCDNAGKHPRTPEGVHDATTDKDQIRKWWDRWNNANIGIATGKKAGIFVLDVDPRHGGDASLRGLMQQNGPLPETWTVATGGGGLHLYFRYPHGTEIGNSANKVAPGIDVKGTGGYVLAPPSLHASGNRYELVRDARLAEAPDWLLAMIAGGEKGGGGGGEKKEPFKLPDTIPEGDRNDTLFRFGCSVYRRGMTAAEITAALQTVNAARCRPPLDGDELQKIVASVLQQDRSAPAVRRRSTQPMANGGKPVVIVNGRFLDDIRNEVAAILLATNDPVHLLCRGTSLVRVVPDKNGNPILRDVDTTVLQNVMADHIDFVTERTVERGRGEDRKTEIVQGAAKPPKDVAESILAMCSTEFPGIIGVTEVPIITADGVQTAPGYNAETQLFYAPAAGFAVPPVPAAPTREEVVRARDRILEVICDFPFKNPASRANAVAAMITLVVRPRIRGLVPVGIINKPQKGTGASLLVDAFNLVATGRPMAKMSAPKSEEEWEKKIATWMLEGRQVMCVDNLEGILQSAELAKLLTEEEYSGGRRLGKNESIRALNRTVWFVNGNNVAIGGDIARRCYLISLDAQHEAPWERDDSEFRHPNLVEWILENRSEILRAILTVIRGWMAEGSPKKKCSKILGGYREWQDTLHGILDYMGLPGFMENQTELYTEIDQQNLEWGEVMAALYALFKDTEWAIADVTKVLRNAPQSAMIDAWSGFSEEQKLALDLRTALPDYLVAALDDEKKGAFGTRFGHALNKRRDQTFPGGFVLRKGDVGHGGGKRWRIIPLRRTGDKGDNGDIQSPTPEPQPSSGDKGDILTPSPPSQPRGDPVTYGDIGDILPPYPARDSQNKDPDHITRSRIETGSQISPNLTNVSTVSGPSPTPSPAPMTPSKTPPLATRSQLLGPWPDLPRGIHCEHCGSRPGRGNIEWYKENWYDGKAHLSRWLCGKCYNALPEDKEVPSRAA